MGNCIESIIKKIFFLLFISFIIITNSTAQYNVSCTIDIPSNESYKFTVDTDLGRLRIGTEQEMVEYKYEKDTVTSDFLLKDKLFEKIITSSIVISNRRKISKENLSLRKILTDSLGNKVYYIHKLDNHTFLVGTHFFSFRQLFKPRLLCFIVQMKNNKITNLFDHIFKPNSKLNLYQHNYWGKYILVEHKKKSCKSVTIHHARELP